MISFYVFLKNKLSILALILIVVLGVIFQAEAKTTVVPPNFLAKKDSIFELLDNESNLKIIVTHYDALYYLSKKHNLRESLSYIQKGFDTAKLLKDTLGMMSFAIKLGDIYEALDSLQAAKKSYEILADLSFKGKYIDIHLNSLNDIGNVLFDLGDYSNSLAYYQRALRIAKEEGKEDFETIPLGNMSELFINMGQLDEAKLYLEKALVSTQKNTGQERSYHLTVDYWRFGDIFRKKRETAPLIQQEALLDSVIFYHKKALKEAQKTNIRALITNAFITLSSSCKLEAKYYAKAMAYSDSSLQFIEKVKDFDMVASAYLNAAQVHFKVGNLKRSLFLFEKVKDHGHETENSKIIAISEAFMRDYQKAINPNVSKSSKKTRRHNVRSSRDALTIEQQNRQLKLTNDQLKKSIFLIAGLFMTLIAFTLYHFITNRKKDKATQAFLKKEILEKTKSLDIHIKQLQRFNYIVSHDLKEPIRNIISFCGLISHKLKQNNTYEISEYLEYIVRSANQLGTLVEGITEFFKITKKENLATEKVDLNSLINEVIDGLRIFIQEKNGKIILPQSLPAIETHRLPLFIAFKNLIENGLKYNQSDRPTITVNYQQMPDKHCIYVKDNGIGIEQEYLNTVFEMFKRLHTKSHYEGTGLGLALCKEVLQKINGNIAIIESTIDEGTIFRIDLPIIVSKVVREDSLILVEES